MRPVIQQRLHLILIIILSANSFLRVTNQCSVVRMKFVWQVRTLLCGSPSCFNKAAISLKLVHLKLFFHGFTYLFLIHKAIKGCFILKQSEQKPSLIWDRGFPEQIRKPLSSWNILILFLTGDHHPYCLLNKRLFSNSRRHWGDHNLSADRDLPSRPSRHLQCLPGSLATI